MHTPTGASSVLPLRCDLCRRLKFEPETPGRRRLLDLLHAHDGRTLNELCEHLDMTRQGVTQHLDLLEAANLVATVRRGREKLHFLNPVPLQEIYERWIAKFEKPRLRALSDLKKRLEKANG